MISSPLAKHERAVSVYDKENPSVGSGKDFQKKRTPALKWFCLENKKDFDGSNNLILVTLRAINAPE